RVARAELVLRDDTPVVRVAEALQTCERRHAHFLHGVANRRGEQPADLAVANRLGRRRFLDRQPSVETVAAWVHTQLVAETRHAAMATVLEALEVRSHLLRAPR